MQDLEKQDVEFTAVAPQPRTVRLPDMAPLLERVRFALRRYWLSIAGTVVGVGIGLYIGWIAAPVEWTNIGFANVEQASQVTAVEVMSDLNAYSDNRAPASLLRMAARWDGVERVACGLAVEAIENEDYEQAARMIALSYSVAGDACGIGGER